MNLSEWTSLAIILLSIEIFILSLVPLVIFYFGVRGMMRVNRTLPRYFKLGQYYSGIVRDQTTKISRKVADPAVRVYGVAAQAEAIARNLQPDKQAPPANSQESKS